MSASSAAVSAVIATSVMNQAAMENSLRELAVEQRVQAISDMFGVRPMSPREYRQERQQPSDLVSVLLLGAVGIAIGISIGLLTLAPTGVVVLLGILGAVAGGSIEPLLQRSRAMEGYGNYLNNFASRAREAHERQQVKSVAAEVERAPQKQQEKQWAEDVTAAREKPVAAGAVQP